MTAAKAYQDVEAMSKKFGLSDVDCKNFLHGKVVTQDLDATTDKDLSVLVVAQVNANLEKCWEFANLNVSIRKNDASNNIQDATRLKS